MEPITTAIVQQILSIAVDKAAQVLLAQFDDTAAKIEEIDQKVDALMFGDYRTACQNLVEANLMSGPYRATKLKDALRLYELSDGRIRHFLEKKRNDIKWIIPNYKLAGYSSEEEKNLLKEAALYAGINSHFIFEQSWLLCRIGALRVAMELPDSELLAIKAKSLDIAVNETIQFLDSKRQEKPWEEEIGWLNRAFETMIEPSIFLRLATYIFVEKPEKYLETILTEYNKNINRLKELRSWVRRFRIV